MGSSSTSTRIRPSASRRAAARCRGSARHSRRTCSPAPATSPFRSRCRPAATACSRSWRSATAPAPATGRSASAGPRGPGRQPQDVEGRAALPRPLRSRAERDTFVLSGAEDLVPVAGATAGTAHTGRAPRACSPASSTTRPPTSGRCAPRRPGEPVRPRAGRRCARRGGRPGAAGANLRLEALRDHRSVRQPHRYDYWRDRGASRQWDQLYLARIRYVDYGADRFLVSVSFDYEERPDPFSDYRAGFEIRTRCAAGAIRSAPMRTGAARAQLRPHLCRRRGGARTQRRLAAQPDHRHRP